MIFRTSIILILLALSSTLWGEDARSLSRENRLLAAELELAKKNANYCIVQLNTSNVTIKAKGTELRNLSIVNSRYWGNKLPDKPITLSHRSSFTQPKREKIDPSKEQKDKTGTEIEALELKDMPVRYKLTFDDNIYVTVYPGPKGISEQIFNFFMSFYRYIFRPLISLWMSVKGQPYTVIDMELSSEDAKALYWALPEGTQVMFYPPHN